jgi:protein gp37
VSAIEWTDKTWNPTRGCCRVSPGCENCYAEKVAARFCGPGMPYEGLVTLRGRWNGDVRVPPDKLTDPLQWRKPCRIFVDSMSDLFYEEFSDEQIAAVFGVMAACPRHTFQVLTKRPERARKWFEWVAKTARTCNGGMSVAAFCLAHAQRHSTDRALAMNVTETCALPWPLPNVQIGASVENQKYADARIPELLRIPAAVRFVSYEPALGPVDFTRIQMVAPKPPHGPGVWLNALTGHVHGPDDMLPRPVDWLIVGGESGSGARPFDIAWARSVVAQCKAAGVPVFVKQMGAQCISTAPSQPHDALYGWEPTHRPPPWPLHTQDAKGGDMSEWPADLRVREFPPCAEH